MPTMIIRNVTGCTLGIGFNRRRPEIARTARITKIKPGFLDLFLLSVKISEAIAIETMNTSRRNCSLGDRVTACASNNIGK